MARVSFIARVDLVVAILALLAILLGPLAARLGLLSPLAGFSLFAFLGLLLGGPLTLVLGLFALFRTRPATGLGGRNWAWLGTLTGGLLVVMLAVLLVNLGRYPVIHDITTDPRDPPPLASSPETPGQERPYPQGGSEVPEQQRSAYPDLQPLELDVPPAQVFSAAGEAARALGWTVHREEEGTGTLQAYATTPVFRFVDDVAVRIRPRGDGSVVDARSTSRVGESDLGANARRIRAFLRELKARIP